MIVLVSSEVLKGKSVIGKNGISIGNIEGVEISEGTWKVTYFHVSLSDEVAKQLGFKTGLVGIIRKHVVSIPTKSITNVGDVVITNVEMKDLERMARPEVKATS